MPNNCTHCPPGNVEPAAPGVTAVMTVDLGSWADAWIAFFDTLGIEGITAMNTFAGATLSEDAMEVTLCQRVPDVDPVVVGGDGDGDDEFSEWGWPVRIEVAR